MYYGEIAPVSQETSIKSCCRSVVVLARSQKQEGHSSLQRGKYPESEILLLLWALPFLKTEITFICILAFKLINGN